MGLTAFFKRQLEYVKRNTYDTKYKELKAFTLFPISQEAPSGATQITYRKYSGFGFAKIIEDWATDFPRVDELGEEVTTKIYDVGASYGYSLKEIRASQMANNSLDQRRANKARRAVDEKLNTLAFNGQEEAGINGFIDYPGINEYTVENGDSGDSEWNTKTPDEIVADISGLKTAVIDITNGVEMPDTLLVPISQYTLLANTRMTGNSDKNIMSYLLDNEIVSRIEWVTELKEAGASSSDRMMIYKKDPDILSFEIPVLFEELEEDKVGASWTVPVHAETAGVIVYYPLAIAFGDGI